MFELREKSTSDERNARLADRMHAMWKNGYRVESQGDYQTTVRKGRRTFHRKHVLLTVFTCGVWGAGWLLTWRANREKRASGTVDEWGKVSVERL